ncbi:dihydrolipoamide acetyltransferase family protein [Marinobacter salicampi]|uniref:dihydrolipoamide acetyltransferase family protein n=1 Tax=Marinobacter salicampi TaxID=435907 RepID=UPI0014096113|nr:dihydrolipoamide acetyltransferase family protein [Marinobacter salicampi]
MAKEYKLEDPGEGITEAEIVGVHVSEGDQVKDGDLLVSVETDKAVNDITAPFNGTIKSVEVSEDDFIKVGQVLVTYTEEGDSGQEDTDERDDETDSAESDNTAPPEQTSDDQDEEETAGAATGESEQADDDDQGDDDHEEAAGKEPPETGTGSRKQQQNKDAAHQEPVPAAPATRKLARELDVDLHQVEPSGPGGRVVKEDVKSVAEDESREPEGQEPKPDTEKETSEARRPETPALPDFERWGSVERQKLRSVRRAIARQTASAWQQIPHVMHQDVADVTELERFRRRHKDAVEARGGKLTLTVLVLKAAVAALKQYPRFNASLDVTNDEVVLKHYHHFGMAVATDRGLLVPVIRDVDRKDVTELAVETVELANRARDGELSRDEMVGASFSITNPGSIGGTSFTPLINAPEAAILGMCATRLEPVAVGDLDNYRIEARLQLPLCLTYDHRLNDGADAAGFLRTIIQILQDPESFLLAV